jgi:hypothetical protein
MEENQLLRDAGLPRADDLDPPLCNYHRHIHATCEEQRNSPNV